MTDINANLRTTLDHLEAQAESLNTVVMDINETDLEQATDALLRVQELVKIIRDSEAAIELWIEKIFKDQKWAHEFTDRNGNLRVKYEPQETPLGVVEIRRSSNRRDWDHEALAKDWLDSWLEKNAEGGVLPSPWQIKNALMEVAGIGYWKVGVLKELGIDPDEYCDSSPGTPRVKVTHG